MRLNENIALAKSILRKNNIEVDSDEYNDYLTIREFIGSDYSYIGILTRLRFVDKVTDLEELKSIYDVLKGSKLDIGKLNKMSYEQILDTFYDDLTSSVNRNKNDYELIYKDDTYSFFRVYSYKGILEIGSPAWCLKTKSNWDNYQSKYPEQWVVIDNRYIKNIITPNNSYLGDKYVNSGKTWVRFGVSIMRNNDNTVTWLAHDDNDGSCKLSNYTFYGVLYTVLNLSNGINKSYYQRFVGCDYISDGVLKIRKDVTDATWTRLGFQKPSNVNDVNYLSLSKAYSYPVVVLRLREKALPCAHINTTDINKLSLSDINITGKFGKLIAEYVKKPVNIAYIGLKIKLGLVSIEDASKLDDFILQEGKWLVFHWNKDFFISIDCDLDKSYNLPTMDTKGNLRWDNPNSKSPSFYLIDKESLIPAEFNEPIEHVEIIRKLKELFVVESDEKKVSGFWDFLKNKK